MISQHTAATTAGAALTRSGSSASASAAVFVNAPCSVSMSHAPAPGGKFMVHCAIEPPADGIRQPCLVLLAIDTSGSMGTSLPDPMGEKGAKPFTRLDLAKQVCLTSAHMLGDDDVLCIVGFSSKSSVILKPTRMTAAGKETVERTIKTLVADGGTNIWSALQLMNKVANKAEYAGRNIVAALLTDGETSPETSPRRGEVETYRSLNRPEKLSVFGFGYEINSKLLYQLASVSNCTFGFIPDFSMVATVFINWMAAAVSTASLERTLTVSYADGSTSEHKTGLIQFGQPRNMVFLTDHAPMTVALDSVVPTTALETLCPMANARFELLNKLQFCIGQDGATDYLSVYNKYKDSSDPQVRELMRDIKPAGMDDEGQVSMAVNRTHWAKWGKHYTRAYYTAVLQETCVNFKDPGLQIYGGKLFKDTSEAGDNIFRELPAPEPSGVATTGGAYSSFTAQQYGAAAATATATATTQQFTRAPTLAQYHNAGGGCWAPKTKVLMADGSYMNIEYIKRDDMVWTPNGPACVEHLVVLGRAQDTQLMVQYMGPVENDTPKLIGNLKITPWHPVLRNGVWVQPASHYEPVLTHMPTVYNMVLDKGHIINVNGVLSVTLGHGFTGPVIEHAFFGDKTAVLRDLMAQPGFAEGRPVFKNLKTRNDPATGLITGWYDSEA